MGSDPAAGGVLHRAAAVLDAVAGGGGGMRQVDLEHRLPLPKTTINRLLGLLDAEDLVRIDGEGRIWLGPRLVALGRAAGSHLAAQVRPWVAALHAEVDETVDVSVLEGGRARFVDQLQSTRPLRVVSAVGATFPLHATANGKALLAALPDEAVAPLVGVHPERLTAATITDLHDLRGALADARRDGVALDLQEHSEGISAVGTALMGSEGPVLALSVPVPSERFVARQPELAEALLRHAEEAAVRLGLVVLGSDPSS